MSAAVEMAGLEPASLLWLRRLDLDDSARWTPDCEGAEPVDDGPRMMVLTDDVEGSGISRNGL